MTEKVTEKAPDMEIMAKYHLKKNNKKTLNSLLSCFRSRKNVNYSNCKFQLWMNFSDQYWRTGLYFTYRLIISHVFNPLTHNNYCTTEKTRAKCVILLHVFIWEILESVHTYVCCQVSLPHCLYLCHSESYQGLSLIRGIGAQVKKTVTNRNERLPHTSDNAPIRGADMNDSRPLIGRGRVSDKPFSLRTVEFTLLVFLSFCLQ